MYNTHLVVCSNFTHVVYVIHQRCDEAEPIRLEGYHIHHSFCGIYVARTTLTVFQQSQA